MKVLSSIIIVFSSLLAAGCAKGEVSQGGNVHLCLDGCGVTFYELVPNKEKYKNITINISGFLALTNGILTLQPSREEYLSSVGDGSAISFRVSSADQERIIDSYLYSYVSVRGGFDYGSCESLVGFGCFLGDVSVVPVPGRGEYEDVDDWKTHIDDI